MRRPRSPWAQRVIDERAAKRAAVDAVDYALRHPEELDALVAKLRESLERDRAAGLWPPK